MNLPFKINYKKVLKFRPFQLFFLLQFGYIYIYIRFLQDQVHHHSNRIYEMKKEKKKKLPLTVPSHAIQLPLTKHPSPSRHERSGRGISLPLKIIYYFFSLFFNFFSILFGFSLRFLVLYFA
jgi:hypothetical protein